MAMQTHFKVNDFELSFQKGVVTPQLETKLISNYQTTPKIRNKQTFGLGDKNQRAKKHIMLSFVYSVCL